mmetsp:Transcript_30571/g.87751  ORF Transcript_30571/g.87751 Transcript_30571/m.87751 type:complete len:201 (+) Transcript_30571:445-1047(+)
MWSRSRQTCVNALPRMPMGRAIYSTLLTMSTLKMQRPAVVSGERSPYPTVVIVTMVSHMAICSDSILWRGSTMYIDEENTRTIMSIMKSRNFMASNVELTTLTKRWNCWNRRRNFSSLKTGTTQRRNQDTKPSSSLCRTKPVIPRRMRGSSTKASKMLYGLCTNPQLCVQARYLRSSSTAKLTSKTASMMPATTASMMGG